MLFIFRKLRRSFFLPGKVRTYCAYAVGEIALIMIGILLALQVSDWNQGRKDYAEETQILLRLKSEMEENQGLVEYHIESFLKDSENMLAFTEIIEPDPNDYPEDLIYEYVRSLRIGRTITPNDAFVNSLLTSGKVALISNEELSYLLNRWLRRLEDIDEIRDQMIAEMERFPSRFQYFQKINMYSSGSNNFIENRKSHFPFDQKALLSSPDIENLAETKRTYAIALEGNLNRLLKYQQTILNLIDAELAERGI